MLDSLAQFRHDFGGLFLHSSNVQIIEFIIQQIVTLSKYGHDALDICHP